MNRRMPFDCTLRLALPEDGESIEQLISLSVRTLQAEYYSVAQMDAAIGPVFGVDYQLIADGTYYVVEHDGKMVGCGGWSHRLATFGGDRDRLPSDASLNPQTDAARIRAFFVHPNWARRGLAREILMACEQAIQAAQFHQITMVATLAGEPFYQRHGYIVDERYEVPLLNGLSLPVVRMSKTIG